MSKKVVQTIVLLLLLVGFPLVSWLFLKDGVQYRIDARANLSSKALIPVSSSIYGRGIIQVLYDHSDPAMTSRMAPIVSHFEDRNDILSFKDLNEYVTLRDSLEKVLMIMEQSANYSDYAYLIDTTASIVQSYLVEDDTDMAALAQDIAFLLPLEEDKDFKIKREREK